MPEGAEAQLGRLLDALAAEPDPHTTAGAQDDSVEVHVADSLSGLEVPELRSGRLVADLGSGPGFPGLVLAVANPRARVDLIESTGRKIGRELAQQTQTGSPEERMYEALATLG